MGKKEGPVLIGVQHSKENLEKAKKLIDFYGKKSKTIGIEGIDDRQANSIKRFLKAGGKVKLGGRRKEDLQRLLVIYFKVHPFWASLAVHAAAKGLKLVPIDSRYATDKAAQLVKRARKLEERSKELQPKFDSKKISKSEFSAEMQKIAQETVGAVRNFQLIARPLRDEFFVKRIKREKPSIVIVGEGHCKAIEEMLPVKRRYSIIGLSQKEIRETATETLQLKKMLEWRRKRKEMRRILRKKPK